MLVILTGFAAIMMVARRTGMGPSLVELTSEHGIHAGDLPVLALWLVGLVCGALLLRDSRSR